MDPHSNFHDYLTRMMTKQPVKEMQDRVNSGPLDSLIKYLPNPKK